MAVLVWDKTGAKKFETGLDRAVLYLSDGSAVPWNGLLSVVEHNDKDMTPIYYDGKKVGDQVSLGDYSATMTALTYPDEFIELEGSGKLRSGLYLGDQPSQTFSLCYRTRIGNDVDGDTSGYKIHILYNVTAVPSDKSYSTLSDSPGPVQFEWTINAVPEEVSGFRPTAHIVINSHDIAPALLTYFETILYGSAGQNAALLPMSTIISYITASSVWGATLTTNPKYMTIDSNGNIYTLNNNNTISKITALGVVTQTFATLVDPNPSAITSAPDGTIYVCHLTSPSGKITRITPAGIVTTGWATVNYWCVAIATDAAGNVYTCNGGAVGVQGTVSKVTPSSGVTLNWGATYDAPYDITVDSNGNVYVVCYNGIISKITSIGVSTTNFAAGYTTANRIVTDPSGNIYVVNQSQGSATGVISKITSAGVVTLAWATVNMATMAMACAPDGTLYTVNWYAQVSKITQLGVVTLVWANVGSGPYDIAVDKFGNVYTANFNGPTVSKVNFVT